MVRSFKLYFVNLDEDNEEEMFNNVWTRLLLKFNPYEKGGASFRNAIEYKKIDFGYLHQLYSLCYSIDKNWIDEKNGVLANDCDIHFGQVFLKVPMKEGADNNALEMMLLGNKNDSDLAGIREAVDAGEVTLASIRKYYHLCITSMSYKDPKACSYPFKVLLHKVIAPDT